ncbi:MAG: PH domain-containing protein [Pseudoxanthomonas suwonensis]|nr:PH domain-containing protein [Pseudoxanthomonas suwonensis]
MIEGLELPGTPAATDAPGWQPLPPRGRVLFRLSHALGVLIPALGLGLGAGVFGSAFDALPGGALVWAGALVLAGLGFGAWLGGRRHGYYRWRLDADGFGLRSGRLFFKDVRVPLSRVQHLDIKRGPLERSRGLSTLLIHTAGTREHAVTVPGLDADDAERLRDTLARHSRTDDDDDA